MDSEKTHGHQITVAEQVLAKAAFDSRDESFQDCCHGPQSAARLADKLNGELLPLLTLMAEVCEAAEGCKWLNDCRCDAAYTNRRKHEPNARCGEMDALIETLENLRRGIK